MENFSPVQKTKVFRVKTSFNKGLLFEEQCKNENTNVNAKLNSFIDGSLLGQRRYFQAGKNKLSYNKTDNNFEWSAILDSGQEISILKNLSDNFILDLKKEIEVVIQERNDWAHQKDSKSVAFPKELVGDKNV